MRNVVKLMIFAVFGVISYPAHSDITFNYNTVFSGDTPQGTSPWLTATFADTGTDQVTLTMTASNLVPDEFVSDFDFNLDPTMQAMNLTYTNAGGVVASSMNTTTNGSKAAGDGLYDIEFLFPTASGDRLGVGETAAGSTSVYTITGTGLSASSFNFLSCQQSDGCQSAGNLGPFYAAAHIQAIPGADSGWVAPVAAIPEPADAAMLAAGLALMAFLARRRRAALDAA